MRGFGGFPQKGRLIKVPGSFFNELLPHIDSLEELKVTLYCFWRLQQKEGQIFYVSKREIAADSGFVSGLAPREDLRMKALEDGLERASTRGTLLHVQIQENGYTEDLYFVNTPRGRAAVDGIEKGKWMPKHGDRAPLDIIIERPNIYTLYEQNIGALTPHIADSLRDLEKTFPEQWIAEAIKIAVENNVHRLAYIKAILQDWQDKGRDESSKEKPDSQSYISGKYRDEIEY